MLFPLHGILLLSIRNQEQMPWAMYLLGIIFPLRTGDICTSKYKRYYLDSGIARKVEFKGMAITSLCWWIKKVCKQAKERCYIIMYSTGKGIVLRKQCQEIRREIRGYTKSTGIKKGLQSR